MIPLVTVPHTGTIFTQDILTELGFSSAIHHVKAPQWEEVDASVGNYWRDYPERHDKIVCTLRDPIMAAISSLNRDEGIHDYGHMGGWQVLADWHRFHIPNVFFFPVDCPIGERVHYIGRLAHFLNAAPISRMPSWKSKNSYADRLVLKEIYKEHGAVPEILQPTFDYLTCMPAIKNLFLSYGYKLPWMTANKQWPKLELDNGQ